MQVVVCDGCYHLARPEDVVRQQESAAFHERPPRVVAHEHPVVGGIFAFVAVDEDQIERTAQRRGDVERRTDVEPDLPAAGRAVEETLRQLFQFVVHLDRVERGPLAESGGHRERRVTREGADFEDAARTEHPHEHFEQFSLDVSREHPRLDRLHVSLVIERPQQFRFGCGEAVDVFFECVHHL